MDKTINTKLNQNKLTLSSKGLKKVSLFGSKNQTLSTKSVFSNNKSSNVQKEKKNMSIDNMSLKAAAPIVDLNSSQINQNIYLQFNNKSSSTFSPADNNNNVEKSTVPKVKFGNDEELLIKEKKPQIENNISLSNLLNLEITSNKKKIRLEKNKKIIPIKVSFDTKEDNYNIENRPNLDLVCVIDKSGSMRGQKIDLVKQSFTYLFELLGDNDRVAIITFNSHSQIISHLLRTTVANKNKLLEMINSIQATGSTNIEAGIHLGLKILKQRKYINDQASIFLLSDGIDDERVSVKERVKAIIDRYESKIKGNYVLNTFGYGKDTDSTTMLFMADSKDGMFYFIENLTMVDECFADGLGSMLTAVGQNLSLCISTIQSCFFPDIYIQNGMGGSKLWKNNPSKTEYTTEVSKIIIGRKKDYVLNLVLPGSNSVIDIYEDISLVNATLTVDSIISEEKIKLSKDLKITFFSGNKDIEREDLNPEFTLQYYRLRLAEAMEEAKNHASSQNYGNAKKVLQELYNEIISLNKQLLTDNIMLLLEEIKIAIRDVKPEVYKVSGQHNIISNLICNLKQKSSPSNVQYYNFSNTIQKTINTSIKTQKSKK